jgi:hypothetical protein
MDIIIIIIQTYYLECHWALPTNHSSKGAVGRKHFSTLESMPSIQVTTIVGGPKGVFLGSGLVLVAGELIIISK